MNEGKHRNTVRLTPETLRSAAYFVFLSMNGEGHSPAVYVTLVVTESPAAYDTAQNTGADGAPPRQGFQPPRAPPDTPKESGNFPPAGHFREANSLAE